jgi:hypothetical protein
VAENPSLNETLTTVVRALQALRRTVADAGQNEKMQEVDALLGVALAEAERGLARLEAAD